jgi:hypothetical protein
MVQQLGASPRPRTIAAWCSNADGAWFALTATDLHALPDPGPRGVLSGGDLVEAVPVSGAPEPADPDVVELADLSRCWDDAVYRTTQDGRRIHGKLAGVHGLVRIRAQNCIVYARDLLEIRFDGEPGSGDPQPSLCPQDLGALISLASGGPCGVLVASSGSVGYAVPLRQALTERGLALRKLPAAGNETELGVEAWAFDVARVIELDLGEPPDLADAA